MTITRSKPAPDCYLNAAHRMGTDPTECVVFEDSINGLKSGRAAGAYVVGSPLLVQNEILCL